MIGDMVWAIYIRSIAEGKILKSGIFASIVIICGAYTIVSYTKNYWMIIPAACGAFAGTTLSVYLKNKNKV